MTEESLFYRRFVDDVQRCAAGCAPAVVVEIERRVRDALIAEPTLRERAWARVVAAVNELLAGIPSHATGAAARLRAFVRENADLGRPRDVAITDFAFTLRGEGVLTDRSGRKYLMFARPPRAASARPSPCGRSVPTARRSRSTSRRVSTSPLPPTRSPATAGSMGW